ncbi:MAG: L,D-transpeptidase family protein, partial [Chitinophagales bacterium]
MQNQSLKKTRLLIVMLLFYCSVYSYPLHGQIEKQAFETTLKAKIDTLQNIGYQHISAEKIFYPQDIEDIYAKRGYTPIWIGDKRAAERINNYINCINRSTENGLLPRDYHLFSIGDIIKGAETKQMSIQEIIDLEILLTDAFLLQANHYANGKIALEDREESWYHFPKNTNMVTYFERAVQEDNFCDVVESLLPVYPEYAQLKQTLAIYKKLNWGTLPEVPWNLLLQEGNTDPLIVAIKRRLQSSGDLRRGPVDAYFDRDLTKAVLNYQRRNGLPNNGLIRTATVQSLNISTEKRTEQIKANMERWRWIPPTLSNEYIEVNIPAFELKMIENGQTIYKEKVIVGRENYPTASFSDSMTYIVLNPYWTIPRSIVNAELRLEVESDPYHLVNNDIKVFRGNKSVNSMNIDWKKANWNAYIFRQGPNAYNPMGQVKFMFPNEHHIYIHDTPARHYFTNSRRSYSHGCIRVDQPLKFAEYLLQRQKEPWD